MATITPKRKFEVLNKARQKIKIKMFSYIAAGFGLVAGLAWNDAIKSLIEQFIPSTGNTILAKLIYAFIITVVVSFILWYIERNMEEDKD